MSEPPRPQQYQGQKGNNGSKGKKGGRSKGRSGSVVPPPTQVAPTVVAPGKGGQDRGRPEQRPQLFRNNSTAPNYKGSSRRSQSALPPGQCWLCTDEGRPHDHYWSHCLEREAYFKRRDAGKTRAQEAPAPFWGGRGKGSAAQRSPPPARVAILSATEATSSSTLAYTSPMQQ